MRKILFTGVLLGVALGEVLAGNGNRKPIPVQKIAAKFESNRDLMLKYAQIENRSSATAVQMPTQAKKVRSTNSVSATNFVDLGSSLNPFSIVAPGRNYVSVVPELNTVAFIRRGGANDPGGTTNAPQNRLYFDYSTQGGSSGWQLSKGPLWTDENYTSFPTYSTTNNFGARYPQGALWNPSGNTDPANSFVMGVGAILDGTNGTWGGQGRGWKKLTSTGPWNEAYWPSGDVLHYITDAMEVTSTGSIFISEPELDVSGGTLVFTDKILIYKYSYNSTSQSFDSSVTALAFPNEGGDYASSVGNTAISFSPDGQNGYIVISGFNIMYDSTNTLIPYFSKTTDGGNTWSPFKVVNVNYKSDEFASPDLDGLREKFLGNYVRFTADGVVSAQRGDEYSHRVDYMLKDMDLTVDQHGYAHLLAQFCVTSFGDTLQNDPGAFQFYPGYGSWMADFYIKDLADTVRGVFLGSTNNVRGCFGGDCPDGTASSFREDSRPQVARSGDGSTISFVWFATDEDAHPQLTTATNSNPDLWMRTMKVTGPGQFKLNSTARNMTKGSDNDGLIICGSVAPLMLNRPNGFSVAATSASLAPNNTSTSPWPTQHLFITGLNIPSAIDSFPETVVAAPKIVKTEPVLTNSSTLKMIVSPNPNKGIFAATVFSKESGIAKVTINNSLGQLVSESSVNLSTGETRIPFNLANQGSGLYFMSVQQNRHKTSYRILKD